MPIRFDSQGTMDSVVIGLPPLTYDGTTPHRDAIDLMTLMQEESKNSRNGLVLDLGCGQAEHQSTLESMGYRYVGVDHLEFRNVLRADAHALPFRDSVFDVVLSVAVMEHLHNPHLAMSEVRRVAKGGSLFVGVAAFGEPFHDSYFHLSAWGLAALLTAQGFRVERFWNCRETLRALAMMGGYPRVIRWMLSMLCSLLKVPFLSPRRWLGGPKTPSDTLRTAGSIGFCARKRDLASEPPQ